MIPDALLALIPDDAERLPVGRRGCSARHVSYRLHHEVLEAAKAGKHVERLKAGDPYIFGRGGEEALAVSIGPQTTEARREAGAR